VFHQEGVQQHPGKIYANGTLKMGINRSTPTEVRYGLALYASMSISELWPLQGSTKNKLLIGHLQKSDNVGTNLQVELDCLQLQAGVSWDVLSREGTMIRKYVNKCWTSHLWEFNDRYVLTVKQEDKAWLLPQREHDQFIMEALTNIPAATSKRLRGAQGCSLFLQVTTSADITNSAGTKLSKWVTSPRYSQPSQQHASFSHPNQAKPNSTVWNDSVKLLQLAFTDGTNNKLRQPLGNCY
jgi:hypothetical protein